MGQSAEELRQDIADTRGQLGQTVDAIADQVSPGRIVERRKQQVRSRWSSMRDSVIGRATDMRSSVADVGDTVGEAPQAAVQQAQGHPMVVGAIGFGIGFLAAAVFPGTDTEGQVAQKVQEAAQPAIDQIKQSGQEAVSALKEPTQQAAQELKDTAAAGAGQVRDAAQDAAGDTKDAAVQASQQVAEQTKHSTENVRQP